MNTKERLLTIENGPNREALVDAFKYVYDKNSTVNVEFKVAIGYTGNPSDPTTAYIPMHIRDIRIVEIEHEDGSGYSFNLEGYCQADLYTLSASFVHYRPYAFKAYYNAKTRRGHISFTSK